MFVWVCVGSGGVREERREGGGYTVVMQHGNLFPVCAGEVFVTLILTWLLDIIHHEEAVRFKEADDTGCCMVEGQGHQSNSNICNNQRHAHLV